MMFNVHQGAAISRKKSKLPGAGRGHPHPALALQVAGGGLPDFLKISFISSCRTKRIVITLLLPCSDRRRLLLGGQVIRCDKSKAGRRTDTGNARGGQGAKIS